MINREFLSAVIASEGVVGLSVDFLLVAAPPSHTALITAKPLRLLLGNLNDFSSAKIASGRGQGVFVPADK